MICCTQNCRQGRDCPKRHNYRAKVWTGIICAYVVAAASLIVIILKEIV